MSLDVEEFDIPEEYGQMVDPLDKITVSSEGLTRVLDLFEKLDIMITCFTTVYFAQNQPTLLKRIIQTHELASHGYYHSKFQPENLLSSRLELERLSGKKVYGFRQPRFETVDEGELFSAGYAYNSSENPIWVPGRYMNLFKPRVPYLSHGILNLPISTSPIIRYPLFWLSFKNSPLWLFKCMSRWALETDGYLNIFFHPWEFSDLSNWRLPTVIKRSSGREMLAKLEKYLICMKTQAEFITCSSFADMFYNTK
jgi:peptidoglycan/xylan/chitin deacetylase (PgdA/CDA1 family)